MISFIFIMTDYNNVNETDSINFLSYKKRVKSEDRTKGEQTHMEKTYYCKQYSYNYFNL